MSRWTARHGDVLTRELDADETILAAHRVEVRGSVANAIEGGRVHTRGSSRRRWTAATDDGFVVPGPIFVLGVSNRRMLVWRSSRWLARPTELEHAIPLADVARMLVLRRLGRANLAVLLEAGPLLMVQSLWGRGLTELQDAFERARERPY